MRPYAAPMAHIGERIHKPSSARPGYSIHDRRTPKLKQRPIFDVVEISIGRQHDKFSAHANLRQQGIDGSNLNTAATTLVAQICRTNMIAPHVRDHGDRLEMASYLRHGIGSANALQQLPEHGSGGEDPFTGVQGIPQAGYLGAVRRRVAPQGKGRTLVSTNKFTGGCVRVCSRSRHSTRVSGTDPSVSSAPGAR